MEEAGFEEIRVYIMRRKNTVVQYIVTRPIMDLCERSVLRLRYWVSWRWWDHEGIYLEGTKEISATDLEGEEEKYGEGAAQEEKPILN